MKTLKLIATGIILFAASTSQAQVSINVNLGAPAVMVRPTWVPQNHVNVDFYYIPDIQAYYDVNASLYVYLNNGNWVRTRYVPVQYRHYDLNRAHRIALNGYHGSRPYTYYNHHNAGHHNKRYYNTRHYEGRRYADNHKSYGKQDKHDNRKNNHNGHRGH